MIELTTYLLGCYPYQQDDPFVLQSAPHIFFIGNQPSFRTTIVEDTSHLAASPSEDEEMANNSSQGRRVRVISLPRFSETGELVLVDAETLEVEVVRFSTIDDEAMKNS